MSQSTADDRLTIQRRTSIEFTPGAHVDSMLSPNESVTVRGWKL
jgi:hypothetical protein